jgi:hypothetical protein
MQLEVCGISDFEMRGMKRLNMTQRISKRRVGGTVLLQLQGRGAHEAVSNKAGAQERDLACFWPTGGLAYHPS